MLSAGSEFSYVAAIYPNKKRQHFLSLTPLLPSNDDTLLCRAGKNFIFREGDETSKKKKITKQQIRNNNNRLKKLREIFSFNLAAVNSAACENCKYFAFVNKFRFF